ncbi:HvfC/BufC N-terminal domain-containing protein [Sulfitobacter guttiformis]|uniref:Putative DNA-binding protein n=1 Tax=Sulfitobacter guttiformis TaxID=74349 RepID=A0A420DJS3_9RHOB|nr:DNA-binding domain-containing protein [Sulfitobacter guttiformis]KIN71678.1 DUF2063 domain containing protein [Sulfitobacter guttiformis KCTC 32187]RKE94493.1 putative DNA-binding protein [Sulfitobacter guttiformis]
MPVTQEQFRAALLDVAAPVPKGLLDACGAPAGSRYGVYRNNVTHSLVEAMKVAFPLARSLLGAQNFDSLMPVFVRANPPKSPMLMHYGVDFPAFLEGFPPLKKLGYLGDVARLDLAFRASYHAADAMPFDATVLQQAPEVLTNLRLHLAPSTILIRSRWPLFDLWRRATDADAPQPRNEGQAVLVTRPEYDPALNILSPGAATWLIALGSLPVGEAVEAAVAAAPEFDFAAALTLALQSHAFHTPEKDHS